MSRSRSAATAGAVLLAVASAGCLDFAQPGLRDAVLNVTVRISDSATARAEVVAFFEPGSEPDGTARPVADPSIVVLGTAVEPAEGMRNLSYLAEFDVQASELDAAEVLLEGPRLFTDRGRESLSLPLAWRAGDDSVTVPTSGDLELPLRGVADGAFRKVAGVFWSLEVRSDPGSERLYSASGEGAVPDTLEVPGDVFRGAPDVDGFEVVARISATRLVPAGEPGYQARLALRVTLIWHVTSP